MEEEFNTPGLATLEVWFSEARMKRYASSKEPAALYVWDERLQKAFLEDVAHIEVLLRNFIATRLANDCERATGDREWYAHPERYNTSTSFGRSVEKARVRLSREGKDIAYDRVIAALPMDVWRFLLVSRLEPTVWRALRSRANGGMPHYPGTRRADFEAHVNVVYRLRNRCSHQEHLVLEDPDEEKAALDVYADAIDWVARKIDLAAADWIQSNSRVASVRSQRPPRV